MHSGLRVLHLDAGRELRGGQWQVLALHEDLLRLGADSFLLARSGGALEAAAMERGLPVESLSFAAIWTRRHTHIVHAHDASTHTAAALAGARQLVVARRVAFPVKTGALSRWKYSRAALYLAVSCEVRHELLRAGVPAGKVRVVHDGVPMQPLPVERRDIVALESEDPGKCGVLLRQAAVQGGFSLRFARDLPGAFQYARMFVYLSRAEGLGSAALLAMAAGVPVIASRIPGLAEVVDNGKTGLLVDNEASAVAEAVNSLLRDEAYSLKLGMAGRRAVEAGYLIEHMVKNTLAAYHSL